MNSEIKIQKTKLTCEIKNWLSLLWLLAEHWTFSGLWNNPFRIRNSYKAAFVTRNLMELWITKCITTPDFQTSLRLHFILAQLLYAFTFRSTTYFELHGNFQSFQRQNESTFFTPKVSVHEKSHLQYRVKDRPESRPWKKTVIDVWKNDGSFVSVHFQSGILS